MKLILPQLQHKQEAINYIEEFRRYPSIPYGCNHLNKFLINYSYEDWLEQLSKHTDITNVCNGKIPSFTYFLMDDEEEKIIGMTNIKLIAIPPEQSDPGHVSFSIRPSERNKGNGTKLLTEIIKICKNIEMNHILIYCDKENKSARKIIEKFEAVLIEDFLNVEMIPTLKYRIFLD